MKDLDLRVYAVGSFDGGLVVLAHDEARRLAALNDALEQSSTWGEFLQRISDDPASLSYLTARYSDGLPDPDDAFDFDDVPGFVEGTWPRSPAENFDKLPQSVLALGSIRATAFGGDLLHIAEEQREDVAAALERDGLRCIEDDDLIERACGDWRYGL